VFYTILISLAGIPGFLFSAWLVQLSGIGGLISAQAVRGFPV
jgi:hypothetical protein